MSKFNDLSYIKNEINFISNINPLYFNFKISLDNNIFKDKLLLMNQTLRRILSFDSINKMSFVIKMFIFFLLIKINQRSISKKKNTYFSRFESKYILKSFTNTPLNLAKVKYLYNEIKFENDSINNLLDNIFLMDKKYILLFFQISNHLAYKRKKGIYFRDIDKIKNEIFFLLIVVVLCLVKSLHIYKIKYIRFKGLFLLEKK